MIEVHPGLFVGDERDAVATAGQPGWFIVHACKEPYHRAALGYTTHGAPKGHPEYLVARQPGCVILNLIDAPDPRFIAGEAVMAGVQAIADNIKTGRVLVHCNQGVSRAPTIALLYMALHTELFDDCDYDDAADAFTKIYPAFRPNGGMAGYARNAFAGGDMPELIEAPPIPEPTPLPRRQMAGTIFKF